MRTLNDYIKKHSKSAIYEEYLSDIRDFLCEDIDANDIDITKDIILETLNSHNYKKLQKKILDIYGKKYDIKFENKNTDNSEDYNQLAFSIDFKDEFDFDDEYFKNLVGWFGYYVSQPSNDIGFAYICPTYAHDMSDMVYNKNKGILYHFTLEKNSESILRNGLRIKDSTYRYFPRRIYLYSAINVLDKNRVILDEPYKFCMKVVNTFLFKNVAIFKIDMNKISKNITFYKDDMMEEENSVYVYNSIPPEAITKLDVFK